jgi:hypothetical protein
VKVNHTLVTRKLRQLKHIYQADQKAPYEELFYERSHQGESEQAQGQGLLAQRFAELVRVEGVGSAGQEIKEQERSHPQGCDEDPEGDVQGDAPARAVSAKLGEITPENEIEQERRWQCHLHREHPRCHGFGNPSTHLDQDQE